MEKWWLFGRQSGPRVKCSHVGTCLLTFHTVFPWSHCRAQNKQMGNGTALSPCCFPAYWLSWLPFLEKASPSFLRQCARLFMVRHWGRQNSKMGPKISTPGVKFPVQSPPLGCRWAWPNQWSPCQRRSRGQRQEVREIGGGKFSSWNWRNCCCAAERAARQETAVASSC